MNKGFCKELSEEVVEASNTNLRLNLLGKLQKWVDEGLGLADLRAKHGDSLSMLTLLIHELVESARGIFTGNSTRNFERFIFSVVLQDEDIHESQVKLLTLLYFDLLKQKEVMDRKEAEYLQRHEDMKQLFENRFALLSKYAEKNLSTRNQLARDRERIFRSVSSNLNEILHTMRNIETLILSGKHKAKMINMEIRQGVEHCVSILSQAIETKEQEFKLRKSELKKLIDSMKTIQRDISMRAEHKKSTLVDQALYTATTTCIHELLETEATEGTWSGFVGQLSTLQDTIQAICPDDERVLTYDEAAVDEALAATHITQHPALCIDDIPTKLERIMELASERKKRDPLLDMKDDLAWKVNNCIERMHLITAENNPRRGLQEVHGTLNMIRKRVADINRWEQKTMKHHKADTKDAVKKCVKRMEALTKTRQGAWDEEKLRLLGVQKESWAHILDQIEKFDASAIFKPTLRNQVHALRRFEEDVLCLSLPAVVQRSKAKFVAAALSVLAVSYVVPIRQMKRVLCPPQNPRVRPPARRSYPLKSNLVLMAKNSESRHKKHMWYQALEETCEADKPKVSAQRAHSARVLASDVATRREARRQLTACDDNEIDERREHLRTGAALNDLLYHLPAEYYDISADCIAP